MLTPTKALAITAPVFLFLAALAPDARACGGCYHRASETESTVVTGHRMVLSVSPTQTVLWDQIEYDGDPSEFAWVLPVKKGARVELATDAWFETLDAATTVNVVSPRLDCAPAPGVSNGGGCGSSSSFRGLAALSSGEGSNDSSNPSNPSNPSEPVTVLHRGTVGPYETVTLATDTPGALNLWLEAHTYAVDKDVQPIIDAYVAEGFDFIALRLLPDKGVRAMKPVRVVSPGASTTLPLRMVAAGTGAFVGISLFVITEGRFATKNFPGSVVPAKDLSWDHLTLDSNYAALRKAALDSEKGRTWLTSYAKLGALLSPVANPTSFGAVRYSSAKGFVDTIGEAYINQAIKNGDSGPTACSASPETYADGSVVVVDPCPPGAPEPSECPAVQENELDARGLACGDADDLAVALTGLHPRDVWLTRLDAFLPRAALATDLELSPAADQSMVQNWLSPAKVENEAEACRQALESESSFVFPLGRGISGGPSRGGPPRGVTVALIAVGLSLLAGMRRAQRSARAAVRG